MKKTILLVTTLLCVVLLHAQNIENNNFPLSNEECFQQAELVVEGCFEKVVATYDTKGNGNFNDTYSVSTYKVQRVYKGEQYAAGECIYVVRKGAYLGEERLGYLEDTYIRTTPPLSNHGITAVNSHSPAIFFFVTSDFPDDRNSLYFHNKKYKFLGEGHRLFVSGDIVAGTNGLAFSNREQLYNYMRNFEGFIVPDPTSLLEKSLEKKVPKEVIIDSIQYETQKYNEVPMDFMHPEMMKEKKQDSKKKSEKN